MRGIALALLLTSIAASGTANAATVPPAWTRHFDAPVQWQRATALGPLLVATSSALHAVNADNGEIVWTQAALADMPDDGIEELAGSPLVLLADAEGIQRTVVLNVLNGEIVFDTRAAGLGQISAPRLLPRAGGLLIAGFEGERTEPLLFAYAIDDGHLLWKSDVLAAAMNPRGGALMSLLMTAALVAVNIDPVQSAPLELGDGTFLLGAMGHLMRIDAATGATVWKSPFAGGRFELRLTDARPGNVYVGAEEIERTIGADQSTTERIQTQYQGFRLDDGSALWDKPQRFSRPMSPTILALDRGLVVNDGNSGNGKLLLLDYDSGESLWGSRGRGIEISGLVIDHHAAGSDIVLTTGFDSVWTNKDTEYLLYVLDPVTGQMRFEEPFRTRGRMLGAEVAGPGVIYVTTQEIGIFDPATGTRPGATGLRGKKPIVTASDGSEVYAFNSEDGLLYRFNRETGETVALSQTPFEFEEQDSARALEAFGDLLVLTGQQTVAGFGRDGTLRFHTHFAAPRDPTWLRALAWAEGVRMGMASVSAGMYGAAFADMASETADGSLEHELAEGMQQGFNDLQQGYQNLAGDYLAMARRRYQASAETRDFFFVLAQLEDRRIVLAQVSKRDGSVLGEIELDRDRDPSYQVDDIAKLVFYQPAPAEISGYRF